MKENDQSTELPEELKTNIEFKHYPYNVPIPISSEIHTDVKDLIYDTKPYDGPTIDKSKLLKVIDNIEEDNANILFRVNDRLYGKDSIRNISKEVKKSLQKAHIKPINEYEQPSVEMFSIDQTEYNIVSWIELISKFTYVGSIISLLKNKYINICIYQYDEKIFEVKYDKNISKEDYDLFKLIPIDILMKIVTGIGTDGSSLSIYI